jgi:DtxR family Mn-dependent transcriptional regulator
MLSATAQEYLETIYNITVEGDAVVGARLAEKFRVSPASVSETLHRLQRDGYLTLDRERGPQLTEHGTTVAEAGLRRHRLAERFLLEVLGMDWITAHEEAHALQGALTPAIEARIVARLGNPTTCPHGNPIPGSAPHVREFLRAHQAVRLSDQPLNQPMFVLCISEVVEDETVLLRYLGEQGIRPGAQVVVHDRGPTETGPLMLEVNTKAIALGRDVANKVWVCRQPASTEQSHPTISTPDPRPSLAPRQAARQPDASDQFTKPGGRSAIGLRNHSLTGSAN